MLKKQIQLSMIALFATSAFCQMSYAGGVEVVDPPMPFTVVLQGAWNYESSPSIINSNLTYLPSPTQYTYGFSQELQTLYLQSLTEQGQVLNGFGNSRGYSTFSPAAQLWFGQYRTPWALFHAVAFGDYIAGPQVSATVNRVTNTATFIDPAINNNLGAGNVAQQTSTTVFYDAQVETSRGNFGIGVNGVHYFNDIWFGEAMIGGGITRYHAIAEFITASSASALVLNGVAQPIPPVATLTLGNADHPGASIYRPFGEVELGFGAVLTRHTMAYVFGQGAWTSSRNLTLASVTGFNGQGNGGNFVTISVPDHWYKVGLAFAYSFIS